MIDVLDAYSTRDFWNFSKWYGITTLVDIGVCAFVILLALLQFRWKT